MAPKGLKECVYFKIFTRVYKCVTDRLLAHAHNASVQQSGRMCLCVSVHTCVGSVSTTFNLSSPTSFDPLDF